MIPVIVVRPQPGCNATVAAARALGLDAHGFPLFEVKAVPWSPPAADTFDALLLGSANAPRHAGAALALYRGKPAYVVGQATAEAADRAGLVVAGIGHGGLQGALERLRPGHGRLLRLCGRKRTALHLPSGVAMSERIVYASEPKPMPEPLLALLAAPALVLLHSAEATRHFAASLGEHAIPRGHIALATIGPRVTQAAGPDWAATGEAASPDDKALLALAGQMCKDPRGFNQ